MDIIISGVGGQGTILASKILAYSAVLEGRTARTGETIGMSQRGGCVVSHVRTGDTHSPHIPAGSADLLLSFELCEGVRNLPLLKKNGYAVMNKAVIMPVSTALGISEYPVEKMRTHLRENSQAVFVDADAAAKECGSVKAANTVLIGVAYGMGFLDVSKESLLAAIRKNINPKFFQMNQRAFEAGIKIAEGMKVTC